MSVMTTSCSIVKVRNGFVVVPGTGLRAERFYQSEGSSFSGWVISDVNDRWSCSDPIPSYAEVKDELLDWGAAPGSLIYSPEGILRETQQ